MLRYVKALVLLVFVVAIPAAAYAQASIVGTVKDAVRRRVAGCHGRSVQSGAHREDALGRHKRNRSVLRLKI